ncbi:DMT family transporter [Geodermatophilus tzadiensis]|uniref:DMT family transporter n=1 Tax=Geodermatophilus tzadiensis TaxID=1137988 RepID=UPI001473EB98|nr:DMT family transporter [Geodermatophilus tzadiensis]
MTGAWTSSDLLATVWAARPHLPRGVGDHLPGTLLALLAALLLGLGSVLQHEGAVRAAPDGRLQMRLMVRERVWQVGQVVTVAGAGAQVAALALAPVAIVQPLLAGALVAALAVRTLRTGHPPTRAESFPALLTVGGLAVFVVAAHPGPAAPDGPPPGWATVAALGTIVLAVALTARLGAGRGAALACGVTGGLAAGVAAVLISAGFSVLDTAGPAAALGRPELWGAAVAAVVSQVGAQQAYGRGSLSWSLPALAVLDPLSAVPAARLLLGERLEPGYAAVWGTAALVAVLGIVLLARTEGRPPQPPAPATAT